MNQSGKPEIQDINPINTLSFRLFLFLLKRTYTKVGCFNENNNNNGFQGEGYSLLLCVDNFCGFYFLWIEFLKESGFG